MAVAITEAHLRSVMPRCRDAAGWCDPLNEAMSRFEIDNPHRAAAFLAQIAHESGELQRLTEGLSYSAERLVKVWPKRFPSLDKARPYERHAEKLANCVYANRLGNGDEASGDGWRFRGRGLIQLTGRANYREVGSQLGVPLEMQPELLEQPRMAALSAGHFWRSHMLNALADDQNEDTDEADFVAITRKINGGTAGLASRRAYWQRAKQALGIA